MPKTRKKRGQKQKLRLSQLPFCFYRKEALYWSGNAMELENFKKVVLLEKDKLCVETSRGYLTVTGDELTVAAMEKGRILLHGRFLQVSFSYFTIS